MSQKTLARSVSCSGIGLHSGEIVNMTLHPAPHNEGIVFLRTDLNDNNMIEARYDLVDSCFMSTRLNNKKGATIATVEHIMAALSGMGITNAIVEIDAPEIPIMDGSSIAFCKLIETAGIDIMPHRARSIEILKPISVVDDKGASALLEPCHQRLLSMNFDFHGRLGHLIPNPRMTFDMDKDNFHDLLSDARTFGFYEDAQKLIAAGRVKGASLDNAVIIKDGDIMNDDGLRGSDEFVRHKVLDAVGDLALAGVHIMGHFKGVNSGHALNNALLRALFSKPEAWCWTHMEFCH